MPLSCPDPNFPVEKKIHVLQDGGFILGENPDGAPFWELTAGWVKSDGKVTGRFVSNGLFFVQPKAQFLRSFGAGEEEITEGDLYTVSVVFIRDEASSGLLWVSWGGSVTTFHSSSFVTTIIAPFNQDFRLDAKSGPNSFSGIVFSITLSNKRCVPATQTEDGGTGFGAGDGGDVGGLVVADGDIPQTGYASEYYIREDEIFRSDMRREGEIDGNYSNDLLGGQ